MSIFGLRPPPPTPLPFPRQLTVWSTPVLIFNLHYWLFYSCSCAGACDCSVQLPVSPSSISGGEYCNRQRSWSQESTSPRQLHISNLEIPRPTRASANSIPLSLSPLATPALSPNESRCSSTQGGEALSRAESCDKGDDICIVVTEVDAMSNPWENSKVESGKDRWVADFTRGGSPRKENKSAKKHSSSSGSSGYKAITFCSEFLCIQGLIFI